MKSILYRSILASGSIVLASGCASFGPKPAEHGIVIESARAPISTVTSEQLKSLPEAAGKITAAVYGFRDLTGQNKPAPASGFSTAVTQGADSVLIKALLDSQWFSPVERNGLQNLLTERDLWDRSLRASSNGEKALAPIPPASIIIEGGIVAYDFNVRTGGSGAKYLGIGGSQQYREDVVTINLRAVNAQSGSILHSIDSTKTVFSKVIDGSIFSFISFDSLLEVEAGYSYNESVQRAVVEAIQAGVIHLIASGVVSKSWNLNDAKAINNPAFAEYLTDSDVERFLSANTPSVPPSKSTPSRDQSVRPRTSVPSDNPASNSPASEPTGSSATAPRTNASVAAANSSLVVESRDVIRRVEPAPRKTPPPIAKEPAIDLSKPETVANTNDARTNAETKQRELEATEAREIETDTQAEKGKSQASESGKTEAAKKQTEAAPKPENIAEKSTEFKPSFVMVGAFESKDGVVTLYNDLQSLDKSLKLTLGQDSRTLLYRVRVGPVNNTVELDRLVAILGRLQITTAEVTEIGNASPATDTPPLTDHSGGN